MSKANGYGTATALAKAKQKLKPRVAKDYHAKAWIPVKAMKLAMEPVMRVLEAAASPAPPPPPPAAPATTSSVSANRYPQMLTLCYTLHSAQPITYITVTITGIYSGHAGGQPQQVPVWSIDLHNYPSMDVYLPDTALPLNQTPNTNPMLITITYDTATQQNIPAFTVYV